MDPKGLLTSALEFRVAANGFIGHTIEQLVAIRNRGKHPIMIRVNSTEPDLFHVDKSLVIIAAGATEWIECVTDFLLAKSAYKADRVYSVYSKLIRSSLEEYIFTAAFVPGIQDFDVEAANMEQIMAQVRVNHLVKKRTFSCM